MTSVASIPFSAWHHLIEPESYYLEMFDTSNDDGILRFRWQSAYLYPSNDYNNMTFEPNTGIEFKLVRPYDGTWWDFALTNAHNSVHVSFGQNDYNFLHYSYWSFGGTTYGSGTGSAPDTTKIRRATEFRIFRNAQGFFGSSYKDPDTNVWSSIFMDESQFNNSVPDGWGLQLELGGDMDIHYIRGYTRDSGGAGGDTGGDPEEPTIPPGYEINPYDPQWVTPIPVSVTPQNPLYVRPLGRAPLDMLSLGRGLGESNVGKRYPGAPF